MTEINEWEILSVNNNYEILAEEPHTIRRIAD
jgi:hypothetical protein